MAQRDPTKIQGPADKHQLWQRQLVIDEANSVQPMDAVWRVVRFNIKGYTWGGPPYPSRIEFTELAHSWDRNWLAAAIDLAKALCADTYIELVNFTVRRILSRQPAGKWLQNFLLCTQNLAIKPLMR